MNAVRVVLPRSLHVYLADLAEQEGVTVEQFVASAVAEKASALMAEDYLADRARQGSRERYDAALRAVPDVAPDERDRL
ncbi:toxin-antitoxin system HicB family antitoxin [Rubrivirga sp. S365]|uniref:Toxin-antitoxin system HicB family antitoxin n=1 Tax=Rubrivirga litoralis TaxID=3075598 RepID=A0ABU3BS74_9BACT|nr:MULTISPECIES: toxin-antitoxin system HicB family antitoxin [unclassified Rubrivirga]MDT0632137.1 toxin-antitoxin system HicB family antitoxin [Rubrivirga sp. F394]MDT7857028.1 toxin-antitoxin system HicB family antitoxin [Rubrivirga sp. S365]